MKTRPFDTFFFNFVPKSRKTLPPTPRLRGTRRACSAVATQRRTSGFSIKFTFLFVLTTAELFSAKAPTLRVLQSKHDATSEGQLLIKRSSSRDQSYYQTFRDEIETSYLEKLFPKEIIVIITDYSLSYKTSALHISLFPDETTGEQLKDQGVIFPCIMPVRHSYPDTVEPWEVQSTVANTIGLKPDEFHIKPLYHDPPNNGESTYFTGDDDDTPLPTEYPVKDLANFGFSFSVSPSKIPLIKQHLVQQHRKQSPTLHSTESSPRCTCPNFWRCITRFYSFFTSRR